MLASSDPVERLHAAVALSEAGGAAARDALVDRLDGGDEVDRAAVLTALGGVLARVPTDKAMRKLEEALALAAGPERDAIVDALGRAALPSATKALGGVARSEEPLDRAAVAATLAGHAGDRAALAIVRGLLGDAAPGVRAQAAWALGSIGDGSDLPRLGAIAAAPETDAAADAVAAVGRIAARARDAAAAARVLCPLAADPRPAVRANALAGLGIAGARCGGGAAERTALKEDANEDVRAAAALVLARSPGPDDARALERCARADPSGYVAARCRAPAAPAAAPAQAALVYVVSVAGTTPRSGAAFALLLADGMVHVGTTDRRGAVFDPAAPAGEIALRRPSALVRAP